MASILDKLRGVLRRPTSTSAELGDALDIARQNETRALAAVEKQAAAVAAGYLDEDAKRAKDRVTLADLRGLAEDATMIRVELEKRHNTAIATDENQRRAAVYADAKAQAEAAALALTRTYPKLAGSMIAMVKDLATAQRAVALANAELPQGAAPLEDPEMAARGVPGLPREVVSDEEVELWARYDLNEPVEESFQSEIYPAGGGWGKRGHYQMGLLSTGEPQAIYRRRRFRKVVTREPTNGDYPLPLAAALQLPAVRGSGMLWGDSHPLFTPGLSLALGGGAEPDVVLARLAEVDAAATVKPVKTDRPLRVEWPEFSEVVPLPAERTTPDTVSRRDQGTGSRFAASPFARPGVRAGGRR